MKTLTSSLGALALLCLAAPARPQTLTAEAGFAFATIEGVQIQDPGRTGLAPGVYAVAFDRGRVAAGDRLEVRFEPAGGGRKPLRVVIPAVDFDGCQPPGAPTFGPRSIVRIVARPDGGLHLRVRAEGSTACAFSFDVPAAPGAAPRQGIGRPGGLTIPERPPQCSPPNIPSDAGSPQPSPIEPGLTATPVSPPDGGCELTAFPLRARIQEVEEPALRGALLALRGDVESLARMRPDDGRAISAGRHRVQRDLAALARAARSGADAEGAGRCEAARHQCERACGGRDCCCCTAVYADCLLGH
jgi:hypothetical protein